MGVMLSTPITEKATERGESDLVSYGVSSMQGYRVQMEDRHAAFTALPGDPSAAFFAVYDGHSGTWRRRGRAFSPPFRWAGDHRSGAGDR